MLYCDSCRIKNYWPEGMYSYGKCEVCGEGPFRCHDVHHSALQAPETPSPLSDTSLDNKTPTASHSEHGKAIL